MILYSQRLKKKVEKSGREVSNSFCEEKVRNTIKRPRGICQTKTLGLTEIPKIVPKVEIRGKTKVQRWVEGEFIGIKTDATIKPKKEWFHPVLMKPLIAKRKTRLDGVFKVVDIQVDFLPPITRKTLKLFGRF